MIKIHSPRRLTKQFVKQTSLSPGLVSLTNSGGFASCVWVSETLEPLFGVERTRRWFNHDVGAAENDA